MNSTRALSKIFAMLASVVALQLALGARKMHFPKKGFDDQTGGISWCPAEPALFTCPPTCQYDCRAAGCGPECCSYWPVQNSSSGGRLHHRLLASCPAVPPRTLVLLGIFSMPTLTKAIRRRLFRESILPERGTDAYSVAHTFVLGTGHDRMSESAEPQAVIQRESDAHGDLLLLDLPEHMNRGKTLEFFVAAAHCWGGAGVAWIAKTDDDAYVHLPNLQHALSPFRNVVDGQFGVNLIGDARRINLSCGPQPLKGRETEFCGTCVANGVHSVDAHGASFCKFEGGLYGFTGDVVRWISASADAFRSTQGHALYHGYEDAVSARWMKLGRRGRNAFALGAGRVQGNASARNQSPYTVLVHKLKTDEDLLRVKEVFSRLEASRESLPRPRAACVGGSSGTSSLSLPVATTAGVRVAVLGAHLEGNLGDEYETTPFLAKLSEWGARVDLYTSRWQPQNSVSPHAVRQLRFVDALYKYPKNPERLEGGDYDVLISAPGPSLFHGIERLSHATGAAVILAGITSGCQRLPKARLIVVRESQSFKLAQSADPARMVLSGDFSFSFQPDEALLGYWVRHYRGLLLSRFGQQKPWHVLFIRDARHLQAGTNATHLELRVLSDCATNHSSRRLVVEKARTILASSDLTPKGDANLFSQLQQNFSFRSNQIFPLEMVEQMLGLLGCCGSTTHEPRASSLLSVISDRYHPAMAAHRLGAAVQIIDIGGMGNCNLMGTKMLGACQMISSYNARATRRLNKVAWERMRRAIVRD